MIASGGKFVAVSEGEIRQARRWVEDLEGISPCFSAAAAVAGLAKLSRIGELPAEDAVLVNLTGSDRRQPVSVDGARWLRRENGGWVAEDSDGGAW